MCRRRQAVRTDEGFLHVSSLPDPTGDVSARKRPSRAASSSPHISPPLSHSRALAEKRQAEAARIRDKYPDRIPVWRRRETGVRRTERGALKKKKKQHPPRARTRCRPLPPTTSTHVHCSLSSLSRHAHLTILAPALSLPPPHLTLGHRRKGGQIRHPGHRQGQVPRPLGPHGRPVRVRHPQAHQGRARAGGVHVCQERVASDR